MKNHIDARSGEISTGFADAVFLGVYLVVPNEISE